MLKTMQKGFGMHAVLPVIAILAVLGVGGYLTNHYYDVSQQRKSFMAAKEQVNRLGAAIATETKPTKHQAVQYCDYGHAKWGPVGRTCWVRNYFLWDTKNSDDAIKKYNSTKEILERNKALGIEFQDGSNQYASELRGSYLKTDNNSINCRIVLDYIDNINKKIQRLYFPEILFESTDTGSLITLSCNGDAMAEYFPVRKS